MTPESRRERSADEIIAAMRERFPEPPAGLEKVLFERVRPGPPVGKAVAVQVRGNDFGRIRKAAAEIEAYLKRLPGVRDVALEGNVASARVPDREGIPDLLGALVAAGGRIYRLSPQEPTLEDVYFALHGEEEVGL